MKSQITLTICLVFAILMLTQTGQSVGGSTPQCKELNNINCYMGKNEGHFCSSKDNNKFLTRWYYDRGVCKKFDYKGCYGNRNRFCTREACEQRCQE